VLHDIAAIGVDYDDVVDLLEDEGITKFEASWDLVTAQLSDHLRATPPTSQRSQSAVL
jgi:transaldolase